MGPCMKNDTILILIDDFGQGGAQRQIAMMVREFTRRGRKVIVCRYADRDFLGDEISTAGAELVRLEGGGRLGWLRSLSRLARERQPAVLCAFLVGPATLALLADRLNRMPCPIVVCERCADSEGSISMKRRLGLALYRRAQAIVCNSERQARWLKGACPALRDRIGCIGNAVDLELFPASPPPGGPVRRVVVLGRVVEVKGVAVLANALDVLRARSDANVVPSIEWYGQHHEQGLELCSDAGASGTGIEFMPPLVDVPALLRSADAVLLPSLSEGTPNVVLEAMAAGRVVLTTDVGDCSKMVLDGSTGWVVAPDDPEALADGLAVLCSAGEEVIQRMSRAARTRAEQIASIGSIVDEYEALFEGLWVGTT